MILKGNKCFYILCVIIFYYAANLKAQNDSIPTKSEIVFQDEMAPVPDSLRFEFGPVYETYLNKAERAYRFGFFKRASKFYKLALKINPNSQYIQYKLHEIESYQKVNFSNLFLNFSLDKPDFLIQILTYLSLYFVASLMVVLIVILINRRNLERMAVKKQELLEKYQELLVDYLFSVETAGEIDQAIRNIAESPFNRKILIDQMIDLSINLSGDAKEKLRSLFISLELDKDSVKKVYSQKWHVKVKGFRELAFMDIKDANDEIMRSLHSRNDIVRMEAQLAMVRLIPEDSFGFLDQLSKTFTLWEQLTVYETIMFHNLSIPQFDRWMYSKNKSVVMFALRMIDVFKQRETYPNLFWMLVNDDPEIRNLTIHVIGNLRLKVALPHLKRLYKTENYENCIAIIQAIAKMSDESVLNFLKLVIDKEDDVQLQIEAAMAINNIGEVGEIALKKLLDSDYKNYQIIIKHILDKRIN